MFRSFVVHYSFQVISGYLRVILHQVNNGIMKTCFFCVFSIVYVLHNTAQTLLIPMFLGVMAALCL